MSGGVGGVGAKASAPASSGGGRTAARRGKASYGQRRIGVQASSAVGTNFGRHERGATGDGCTARPDGAGVGV